MPKLNSFYSQWANSVLPWTYNKALWQYPSLDPFPAASITAEQFYGWIVLNLLILWEETWGSWLFVDEWFIVQAWTIARELITITVDIEYKIW